MNLPRRKHREAAALTLAALALASCGGSDLADTDPAGHAACTAWMVTTYDITSDQDKVVVIGGAATEAGDHLENATTPEIAAAVDDDISLPGIVWADTDTLQAACEDNGYEVVTNSAAWLQDQ